MEVLFVVIVPHEHLSEPVPHRQDDASDAEEFTVKEKTPFTHVRDTNVGRRCVLDVVEMVTSALSGLSQGFTCTHDARNNRFCITFPSGGARSLTIFRRLQQLGVGEDFGSISVLPLALSVSCEVRKTGAGLMQGPSGGPSLKMRQIIEDIRAQSKITFDVLMMVFVAGVLAAVGLATNSVVMVVSSMLVSPLMGPLLGMGFGTVIYDHTMMLHGTIAELLMLALCVLTGFLVGLPFAAFDEALQWPTNEMSNRGEPIGLLYGLCVAIPSGVGVAMSILQSNTTGLVGVAISASLLPPAVNTGMFLAALAAGSTGADGSLSARATLEMALFSFLLTTVNIVCIYTVSILWFKVKEIAPYDTPSDVWKCYVAEQVRHLTLKGKDATKMKQMLAKELGHRHLSQSEIEMELSTNTRRENMPTMNRRGLSHANLDDIFLPPPPLLSSEDNAESSPNYALSSSLDKDDTDSNR